MMMKDVGVRLTSSNLAFWSPVLNGRMKQCQKNLSWGENARVNINIRAAQMNRLIVEYKIKEWTECPQILHKNVKKNSKKKESVYLCETKSCNIAGELIVKDNKLGIYICSK